MLRDEMPELKGSEKQIAWVERDLRLRGTEIDRLYQNDCQWWIDKYHSKVVDSIYVGTPKQGKKIVITSQVMAEEFGFFWPSIQKRILHRGYQFTEINSDKLIKYDKTEFTDLAVIMLDNFYHGETVDESVPRFLEFDEIDSLPGTEQLSLIKELSIQRRLDENFETQFIDVPTYVNQITYMLLNEELGIVKIGKTNSIIRRMVELREDYKVDLRLICLIYDDVEKLLHNKFASSSVAAEYIGQLDGKTEWFELNGPLGEFLYRINNNSNIEDELGVKINPAKLSFKETRICVGTEFVGAYSDEGYRAHQQKKDDFVSLQKDNKKLKKENKQLKLDHVKLSGEYFKLKNEKKAKQSTEQAQAFIKIIYGEPTVGEVEMPRFELNKYMIKAFASIITLKH